MRLIDVYAHPDALELLYELLQERPAEANISHRSLPTFEQHRQFVTRRPYEAWYLIEVGDPLAAIAGSVAIAGAVYLTKAREVGIFIFQAHLRNGYAAAGISLLREKHPGKLLANVAPGNQASHALFLKLGGRVIQHTYEL